jgi:hypothetical protein
MTLRVVVTELAETELHITARWYDSRCPGLGNAFLAKFELTVEQVRRFPESFEKIDHQYRRAVLGRFPYFVVYRNATDALRILRVMPERGDPKKIEDFLTT